MNERDKIVWYLCRHVSDDFPVRSLYIDSYYSLGDSPELTTLIYVAKSIMCNSVR